MSWPQYGIRYRCLCFAASPWLGICSPWGIAGDSSLPQCHGWWDHRIREGNGFVREYPISFVRTRLSDYRLLKQFHECSTQDHHRWVSGTMSRSTIHCCWLSPGLGRQFYHPSRIVYFDEFGSYFILLRGADYVVNIVIEDLGSILDDGLELWQRNIG